MANYLGFEPTETSPYYFISYDTLDKDLVSKYVCEMNVRKLPLWYDHGIHMGSKWEQVIAEHLANCEAVILFFSKNIFTKDDSYVRKEFNLAKDYNKKIIVVQLEPIGSGDVPVKYAFWWGTVRDLQGVAAYECRDVDDCVSRLFDELNVKLDIPEREDETPPVDDTPKKTEEVPAPRVDLREKILTYINSALSPVTPVAVANALSADLPGVCAALAALADEGVIVKNLAAETVSYLSLALRDARNAARTAILGCVEQAPYLYACGDLAGKTFGELSGDRLHELLDKMVRAGDLAAEGGYYRLPSVDADRAVGEMLVTAIEGQNDYVDVKQLQKLPCCAVATKPITTLLANLAEERRIVRKIAFKQQADEASYCSLAHSYEKLTAELSKAEAAEKYEALRKGFEKLGDYKDSRALAKQCAEAAQARRPKEEYLRQHPLAARKEEIEQNYADAKKQFPTLLAGVGVLLLVACVALFCVMIWAIVGKEDEGFVLILIGWLATLVGGVGLVSFAAAGGKWAKFVRAKKEYAELKKLPRFKEKKQK